MTKINQLKKGDKAFMKNVGEVQVTGVAKQYLKVVSACMSMKIKFVSSNAPVSDIGLSMIAEQAKAVVNEV